MIIDTNITLGSWPFQEISIDSPAKLAEHLTRAGIGIGYVRSCQAALLPEPEADNRWLQQQLEDYDNLIAVPTINPQLIGWQQMVDFTAITAINIYPNYHSYELTSPAMHALAEKCLKNSTILFITMRMEDIRCAYPHCIVPDVPAVAVNQLALDYPQLKIICLNSAFNEASILTAGATNIYLDIAYCECGATLDNLTSQIAETQIVFGSHTPFFYTHAAIMKVKYADIAASTRKAVNYLNIQRIFS
jgi:hypothetical protein